jgi:hypothetical protein
MGHIYVHAKAGADWVPVELIVKDKPVGWEPVNGITAKEYGMTTRRNVVLGVRKDPFASAVRENYLGVQIREPGMRGILDDVLSQIGVEKISADVTKYATAENVDKVASAVAQVSPEAAAKLRETAGEYISPQPTPVAPVTTAQPTITRRSPFSPLMIPFAIIGVLVWSNMRPAKKRRRRR